MQHYSRRHFLRAAALTAAGAGVVGRNPSALTFAAMPQAGKRVTLEYVNLWDVKNNTHYPGMQYLYKAFRAKHPEITIKEILLPSGDDVKKEKADCGAGACPDIMNDLDGTFWTNRYVLDLMPYLNADPAWKASFDQQSLAFMRTDGHQWGLCNELSPMAVVWNTKILDQAGVGAIPTTWHDLLGACDKIKRIGKTPTSFQAGGGLMFHNLIVGQKGGYGALAANKFDAPQVLEAMKRIKVFVDNKWVASNELEQTYPTAMGNFAAGRLAWFIDGPWTIINNIMAAGVPKDLKQHVRFSPFPALDRGTMIENKVATVIGVSASLPQHPDKLRATLTFLKFYLSPQTAARWIPFTWSPMGVKVSLKDVHGLDPLPRAFLSTQDQAKMVYTLPATKAMQDHQWDDFMDPQTALLQGKSAETALAAYTRFLARYRT